MGELKLQRRPKSRPQVGDMRSRITIKKRGISPGKHGVASFAQTLNVVATVWAKVQTRSGQSFLGDVQLTDRAIVTTHSFMTRFNHTYLNADVIGYGGDNFKVISAVNHDERNEFITFHCNSLGSDTAEVNK